MVSTLEHQGFDAPEADPEADALARIRFSKLVYKLLCPTSGQQSVRVGLAGEWGSGKTSIAKWIEKFGKEDDHIVIWYNPWSISTIDDLWLSFFLKIRNHLNLDIANESDTKKKFSWFKATVQKNRSKIDALAQMNSLFKGLSSFSYELLKITPKEIDQIRKNFKNRRIIVIIDDIDRVDPIILPKLLLSLRELLDLPGFSFLLPFDTKIVSDSLVKYHSSWKNGDDFLEKIFDYKIDLPITMKTDRKSLFRRQLVQSSPSFRLDLAGESIDFLPINPRRIKALARSIAVIEQDLSRHNADEIDWRSLLFAAIVRFHSVSLFNICRKKFFESGFALAADRLNEKDAPLDSTIEGILEEAKIGKNQEICKEILRRWWGDESVFWDTKARYALSFMSEAENLTWKEFDSALSIWRECNDVNTVFQKLERECTKDGRRMSDVYYELIKALPGRYGELLERAAHVRLASAHKAVTAEARIILDFMRAVTIETSSDDSKLSIFNALIHVMKTWVHFNTNPGDIQLRQRKKILRVRYLAL